MDFGGYFDTSGDDTLRRLSVSIFETEEERLDKLRTPEQRRAQDFVESIYDKIDEAREANNPSLLQPIAKLWCDDGMYVNSRLVGSTAYPFSEPSCGGESFVKHLKEFWFDWQVEVTGELGVEVVDCGPIITFKNKVNAWKVGRSGRQIKGNQPNEPMIEHNAIHLNKQGKIQQWIYYVDSSKAEAFVYAFGRKQN